MRKVVLQVGITLDGFMCGPNGELDWMVSDEEMEIYNMNLAKAADVAIAGRVAYDGMASYWTATATNQAASPVAVEFANVLNTMKKVIFTREDEKLDWQNAEAVTVQNGDDIAQYINDMKQQPGENILVYGGVQTAQTFIQHDLVDEYQLAVHPIILGQGRPLFHDLQQSTKLKLTDSTPHTSGAVTLAYQVVK